MRAVYLLLCVALARYAAASIFRHEFRPQSDGVIVQPLDYVDQYQQYAKDTKRRHGRPGSSSEETKERLNYDDISNDASLLRSVDKDWISPLFSSIITPGQEVQFGDVASWHGIDVASGPECPTDKQELERIFADALKIMKHISREDKKKIHKAFETKEENEDVHLNATDLIQKHGYGVEKHTVKTDDGYHLTLFRIQPKQELLEEKNRPVVFLMHGLLGSADDWLLMGPKKSLAYLLSDAGYDVWLGNARGSKYSRRHASKHESHPDFWQFSIDEIAQQDLPAMINYALKTSEQKRLHYIGHSQGTTVFFAWASTHPESQDQIATMHALSPMVYMTYVRSPFLRMIAPSSHFYERLHDQLGHGEFEPSEDVLETIGGNICQKEVGCEHVCTNVNFIMSGVDTVGMDTKLYPVIVSHMPGGASTKQIKHFGQTVTSQEFRKYDYGTSLNKKVYGQRQPPKYNMTDVKVPVNLYYSEEDWLAHPKDVEKLKRELPQVKSSYKVPRLHFSNMDFQLSEKAPELVYKRLIATIKKNKDTRA